MFLTDYFTRIPGAQMLQFTISTTFAPLTSKRPLEQTTTAPTVKKSLTIRKEFPENWIWEQIDDRYYLGWT